MKKFLSLVLALVMTMSLVTVSAGAKDFSDDDSITYQEAVDVISEIGVVDGYTGGDFKPTDVLTRGDAAAACEPGSCDSKNDQFHRKRRIQSIACSGLQDRTGISYDR